MPSRLHRLVEHPWFARLVMIAILLNAVTLGLETSRPLMRTYGTFLHTLDLAFIAFFTAELTLKLVVYRRAFFHEGWNIFDFVIVILTLLPAFGNLSVLRALRVLRVLRLLSIVPRFRVVVQGFFDALGGLAAVAGILFILLYISAVLSSKLFGDAFPELFGTLPRSLLAMFQLMTLEGWTSEIVRPILAVYPFAWLFFIPFIGITTFTLFNLLIGIIVNSMQHIYEREAAETRELLGEEADREAALLEKVSAIESQLAEIKADLRAAGLRRNAERRNS
jgi:voltage-gated sodium channel